MHCCRGWWQSAASSNSVLCCCDLPNLSTQPQRPHTYPACLAHCTTPHRHAYLHIFFAASFVASSHSKRAVQLHPHPHRNVLLLHLLLLFGVLLRPAMSVRLQQLTAPFHSEHHKLVQASLYPLHLSARPQLSSTSCPTASDYLTILQTHCALTQSTLIVASHPKPQSTFPPSAADNETIVGFALYRSIHDTFNTHRLLLEELIVHPDERGSGVGSVLLRYVQQVARDVGALYVTAEVPAGWVECQPLLAKQKFAVQALSFTTPSSQKPTRTLQLPPVSPTTPLSPLSPLASSDVTTTLINIANFSSPSSTALLTALEPIYRQLRPSATQLPPTTTEYLSRLHHILSMGAFHIVAHSSTPTSSTTDTNVQQPLTVYGVATCRHLNTLSHGRRVHIDDLVTDSGMRSRGVGRTLLESVRRMAREEERGGGEGKEGREGGVNEVGSVAVTLESGVHRHDAHRFYWRERFVVRELYWRWQVESAPVAVQTTMESKEPSTAGTGNNTGADATLTVTIS